MNKSLSIGICHYRTGKTDGVSLEIRKLEKVMKQLGHRTILISGVKNNGADHVIDQLEFEEPEIAKIRQNAFGELKDYESEADLMRDINKISKNIRDQFLKVNESENFDLLFLHNIFSHALHLPAAKAFYDVIEETELNTIAFHHDFYWDGPNAQTYRTHFKTILDFLDKYIPPSLPFVKHVTINKVNKRILRKKENLESTISPDTFDFSQPSWTKDNYNRTFLEDIDVKENDLIILQATRIVERKAIELAIKLTAELTKRKSELENKTLYNGKVITQDSKIVFVLSGLAEIFSRPYRKRLQDEIHRLGIEARFADHHVDVLRSRKGEKKVYSLWDTYVYADLVTYPSIWEGWGNQFLEATFAKKPIALFEYPVFKSDIGPEGYSYISFGDTYDVNPINQLAQIPPERMRTIVDESIKTLLNPNLNHVLEKNYAIAKKYHSDKVLKKNLIKILET